MERIEHDVRGAREPLAELTWGMPPSWTWADLDVQANDSRQQKATVRNGVDGLSEHDSDGNICDSEIPGS